MKHYQTIKLVLFITEVIHTWSQTHEFNTFWKKFNLGSFSNNSSHSIKPSSHSLISLSLINNTTGLIENQHFSAYSDPPSRFLHTGLIQTSSENYSLSMLLTNETTTEVAKETTTGKSDEDTSKAIKMTNQGDGATQVTPVITTKFNTFDFSQLTDLFIYDDFETPTNITTLELETTTIETTSERETTTLVITPELETTTIVTTSELETTAIPTTSELETTLFVTAPKVETTTIVTTSELETTKLAITPEIETTTIATTSELETTTLAITPELKASTIMTTLELEITTNATTQAPSKPDEFTTNEITAEIDVFGPEEAHTPSEYPDFTSSVTSEYPKKPKREFNITNNNLWFPLFGDFIFRIHSHKFICKTKQCVRLSITLNSVENTSDSASLFKLFLVLNLNQPSDADYYTDELRPQILGLFIDEPPAIPSYDILPQDWVDLDEIKPITQLVSSTCKENKVIHKIWGLPIWAFTFLVIASVISLVIILLIVGELAKRKNKSLEIIE